MKFINFFKDELQNSFKYYLILFCGIILSIFYLDNNKLVNFINLINDKLFFLGISFIFYLSYQINKLPNNKLNLRYKKAMKDALIALFISLFAKIDLIIAPFWFIFLTSYYLDID